MWGTGVLSFAKARIRHDCHLNKGAALPLPAKAGSFRAEEHMRSGLVKHVGEREPREPALLDCRAPVSCGLWVRHDFLKLERVVATDADGRPSPADAEIYVCAHCGAVRQWGLVVPARASA